MVSVLERPGAVIRKSDFGLASGLDFRSESKLTMVMHCKPSGSARTRAKSRVCLQPLYQFSNILNYPTYRTLCNQSDRS
jgi:hypothetical protein